MGSPHAPARTVSPCDSAATASLAAFPPVTFFFLAETKHLAHEGEQGRSPVELVSARPLELCGSRAETVRVPSRDPPPARPPLPCRVPPCHPKPTRGPDGQLRTARSFHAAAAARSDRPGRRRSAHPTPAAQASPAALAEPGGGTPGRARRRQPFPGSGRPSKPAAPPRRRPRLRPRRPGPGPCRQVAPQRRGLERFVFRSGVFSGLRPGSGSRSARPRERNRSAAA